MLAAFEQSLAILTGVGFLAALSLVLAVVLAAYVRKYSTVARILREDRTNNSDLIENLSEGVYRSTPDGRQLSANRALVRLNGYDTEAEMLAAVGDIGKEWYVDPNRRAEFRAILHRDGFVRDFISEIYRHKTRERIWVRESARLVYDHKSGKPLFYEGSVREITETIRRRKLQEQFQKITSGVPGCLFQFVVRPGGQREVTFLSPGFERITGLALQSQFAEPHLLRRFIHDDDRAEYIRSAAEAIHTVSVWDCEVRLVLEGGEEKWVRITATPEATDAGLEFNGYLYDVTRRKKQEMAIERLAYYDPLTKLPNRRMFFDRMSAAVERCRRHDSRGAVLFVDLDNFKTLNDTQGHDVGDAFLAQVADRLRDSVGGDHIVARIGGDEFVIILEKIGLDEATATLRAITMADRVVSTLRAPFQLGQLSHRTSASVGVVIFDGTESRSDEILKRADLAMYEAKNSGRNAVALYDPASMVLESERYKLLADLRRALACDEMVLNYQPQVDDTGRICGAEALVRWQHPEKGEIFPDRFVPLAEQYGLVTELGNLVLAKGLATLACWQSNPKTARLRLALNVSVQSFASEEFVPHLTELVRRHGVDASLLTLEVTEHVMAKDPKMIARRMKDLKALGVRLSLDDFGTGYSSLIYLKKLPFDEVKIDGGFVADIETTDSDRALVKTILSMARNLGLNSVAEHVENIRQEAFLRAFGCDFYQGYLYSKALSEADFRAHVLSHDPNPALLHHSAPRKTAAGI